MMNNTPIKRHESLRNLSREHHDGLIFSLRLSKGIAKQIARNRIENYARWFWTHHLVDHFKMEEQYLFPLLPDEHQLKQKAIAQHREIEAHFEKSVLQLADLQEISSLVKQHIRFEERELFMYIQENADEKSLRQFAEIHDQQQACPVWEDRFW